MGALSQLDEFLLNTQVRTCSVAVPGTSRSSNLENQGTNEDRPSDDPGPEVEFSSPLSGAETDPHKDARGMSGKIVNSFKNLIPEAYEIHIFVQNEATCTATGNREVDSL